MDKLTRTDLFTLEDYASERPEFRRRVLDHKKSRKIHVGPHATLYFEDRLTIQYQIQEMLRVEKIFEPTGIAEELDAYNPLIPDGQNLKATFMLEFEDPKERQRWLGTLTGIEDRVWLAIDGLDPVWAIADEDLERATEDKTSSVHFLRFELGEAGAEALRKGALVAVGIAHDAYTHEVRPLPDPIRASLAGDLA